MDLSVWDKWHTADSPRFPHEKLIQFVYRNFGVNGGTGKTAFDLGCGSGANTCFLAGEGFETVGVDTSPQAIENLHRRAADLGLYLDALNHDLLTFSAPRGTVDFIVSIGVLEFARREVMAAAIPNAIAALKAGGRALFVFASEEDFRHDSPTDLGIRKISRAEVTEVLSGASLEHLYIDKYITTYKNDSFQQVDWLVTLRK